MFMSKKVYTNGVSTIFSSKLTLLVNDNNMWMTICSFGYWIDNVYLGKLNVTLIDIRTNYSVKSTSSSFNSKPLPQLT